MEGKGIELNASDLRQYVYCPRIIYFRYCLPVRPPPTYKMIEGKLQHERVEELEHRRSLHAYGLTDGERVFDVRLHSERLGVVGFLDMVIVRRHEVIPVEFKHVEMREPGSSTTRRRARGQEQSDTDGLGSAGSDQWVALHHKYQLAIYALLAEEHWAKPGRRCFVYFIPARRAVEVSITPGVREYAMRIVRNMRQMIAAERMPEPTRRVGRCAECEYRRFCNDVD